MKLPKKRWAVVSQRHGFDDVVVSEHWFRTTARMGAFLLNLSVEDARVQVPTYVVNRSGPCNMCGSVAPVPRGTVPEGEG